MKGERKSWVPVFKEWMVKYLSKNLYISSSDLEQEIEKTYGAKFSKKDKEFLEGKKRRHWQNHLDWAKGKDRDKGIGAEQLDNETYYVWKGSFPPNTDFKVAVSEGQLIDDGYFSPASLRDDRERKWREIVQRRGQPDFRKSLIAAYNGKCAATDCDAEEALEAAHIIPYCGPDSNRVSNGLLFRSDIHTLFDLDLLGVHPETRKIVLGVTLDSRCYAHLHGKHLRLPQSAGAEPNAEALQKRWQEFDKKQNRGKKGGP